MPDYRLPIALEPEPHPLPGGLKTVLQMLHTATTDEHKAIIGLCGLAGLRISEARSVRASDFVITPEKVSLKVRGKGDKMRQVPISETLWAVLCKPYLRAHMSDAKLITINDGSARSMITRAGRRLGMTRPIASHDLRMTFATEIYNRTKDIRLVQKLLGHTDPQTTIRYIKVEMDAMHAAVTELVMP